MANKVARSVKKFVKNPKRLGLAIVTGGLSEQARFLKREGKRLITPKIPALGKISDPNDARNDPAVLAAKEKLRLSEKRRRGRRAAILTSSRGVQENTGIIKRIASLGGNPEKLATT